MRLQRIGFLLLPILLVSCSSSDKVARQQGRVQHIVLCWLKEPGSAKGRQRLIDATMTLAEIPGVVNVRVGEALPSDRGVVDDSFDVGLVIELESAEALAEYLVHPIHKKAVNDHLTPLTDRVVIYDVVE